MADQPDTETDHMDWTGLSPKSYAPGYPLDKSLGQPGPNTVTLDDVKRGYTEGG